MHLKNSILQITIVGYLQQMVKFARTSLRYAHCISLSSSLYAEICQGKRILKISNLKNRQTEQKEKRKVSTASRDCLVAIPNVV
jgi:hypothetical protein